MSEKYFDRMKIRKRVSVKMGDYEAFSYEDKFFNQWVGNIGLYKDDKAILHATIEKAMDEQELMKWLENYLALEKHIDKQ